MAGTQEAGTRETRGEVRTEAGTLRLREDGIVQIVLAEKIEITVESAQALHTARRELSQQPRPLLVDIRSARSTDMLAMRFTAGSQVAPATTRLALLVGSPVSRMIGSVFMGMWKTPYPTRLFTDEHEAVAWLLEGEKEAR